MIDAEVLLSSISGKSRENLLISDFKVNPIQIKSFNNMILKRAKSKEPYLLKKGILEQQIKC